MIDHDEIERVFKARQSMLWGLCYRLTGVAADADELVQETFLRALEHPPADTNADWHRWLVRVATNLSLDRLRARRRRGYVGSWLPAPLETPEFDTAEESSTDLLYERMESLSYAFLLALEALTPKARAVLILSDVLEYSAADVAVILNTSETNIRVMHHRARRQLASAHFDPRPLREVAGATRVALQNFVDCMVRQDAAGLQALLAESVRSVTDSGGEYTALRRPLMGRSAVIRFHLETARRRGPISSFAIRSVNGMPALVLETRPLRPQMGPRVVMRCQIDTSGRIIAVHSILAPRKLTAVHFGTSTQG